MWIYVYTETFQQLPKISAIPLGSTLQLFSIIQQSYTAWGVEREKKRKKEKEKKDKPPRFKLNVNSLGRIWKAEMCKYTKGFAQHLPIPASNTIEPRMIWVPGGDCEACFKVSLKYAVVSGRVSWCCTGTFVQHWRRAMHATPLSEQWTSCSMLRFLRGLTQGLAMPPI